MLLVCVISVWLKCPKQGEHHGPEAAELYSRGCCIGVCNLLSRAGVVFDLYVCLGVLNAGYR